MNSKSKLDQLRDKYPTLYKALPYGFQCSDGWYDLLDTLSAVILRETERLPEEARDGLFVIQVKEKFGGLRFYMEKSTPFIDGAISLAESISYRTCEECGQPGRTRNGGWIRVLCDAHHKEKDK